jgi:hypothetical protein
VKVTNLAWKIIHQLSSEMTILRFPVGETHSSGYFYQNQAKKNGDIYSQYVAVLIERFV